MLTFQRINPAVFSWEETHSTLADRTIFQAPAWMNFLMATQKGEPILAALQNGTTTVGYFTGMVVQKFGLRILGSPFPGWSTSYMGLNLEAGVPKYAALEALKRFAFRDLDCFHLELLDRKFGPEDVVERGIKWTPLNGFEVDLSLPRDDIFKNFLPSCRQAIRRAVRLGVNLEEPEDSGFVDDYYAQLTEVFRKQGLVPTYSKDRVSELIRHVQPTGKLLLLRARDSEGKSIATGIFILISPTTMYFWGGASWRAYQGLRPNDLLMWTAMLKGKERGVQIMDLGGAGEYKKKFGGRPISVPWIRVSSIPFVALLRDTAQTVFKVKQRLQAKTHWKKPVEPSTAVSDASV